MFIIVIPIIIVVWRARIVEQSAAWTLRVLKLDSDRLLALFRTRDDVRSAITPPEERCAVTSIHQQGFFLLFLLRIQFLDFLISFVNRQTLHFICQVREA